MTPAYRPKEKPEMTTPRDYKPLKGTEHKHPAGHTALKPTDGSKSVTATVILRRRENGKNLRKMEDFSPQSEASKKQISRSDFASEHGADPKEMEEVAAFAKAHGLEVVESHAGRRSVVVRGSASAMNDAFGVELQDYDSPRGQYHSHTGTVNLPGKLAESVEAVIGLDNRRVPAKHFSTARRPNPADPPNTKPLTPQQVAKLYNFPAGDGTGQTIGIYEMETQDPQGNPAPAGYTVQDLTGSIEAFGGNLRVPQPIDVPVDGVTNSGQSDGETGLDITVAGAVAQGATIAVYFTGGTSQSILHALQAMIHPNPGQPQPSILSISYGFGADDESADSFSDQEYAQLDQLFQDAANLSITVLVSSGDSGAFIESNTQAQTSYPATEPWVTACGGTTIGNVNGTAFDEYVWNDTGAAGHGATGGGISAHFTSIPSYQANANLPKRIGTNTTGRGIPDLAGNASENSGYLQVINGERPQSVGGTSAVAPLYAGLIAIINANLGAPAGFLNPVLYSAKGVFRNISGPPGPANNSFGKVSGYPANTGWNACTGLGSVNGTALQNTLKTALAASGTT
jgi:kumamolisin